MSFAKNLVELRKINNLSQEDLAEKIGVLDRHCQNTRPANHCPI